MATRGSGSENRKQLHTAKRVLERLRDEHGFTGGYTIIKRGFWAPVQLNCRMMSQLSETAGALAALDNRIAARKSVIIVRTLRQPTLKVLKIDP